MEKIGKIYLNIGEKMYFYSNCRKKIVGGYGDGSFKNNRIKKKGSKKEEKTKGSSVALEQAGFPLVNYVNTAGITNCNECS